MEQESILPVHVELTKRVDLSEARRIFDASAKDPDRFIACVLRDKSDPHVGRVIDQRHPYTLTRRGSPGEIAEFQQRMAQAERITIFQRTDGFTYPQD